LSFSIITSFLAAIVALIFGFLLVGTYARKETVPGFLMPDTGIARIHPPRTGTIGQVFVSEGQHVGKGAPLVTVVGVKVTGSGLAVDTEMLANLDRRIGELQSQLRREERRSTLEGDRLKTELANLADERAAIDEQRSIQTLLQEQLRLDLSRISKMADKGYVSQSDVDARRRALLDNDRALASLREKLATNATRVGQARAALARQPLDSEERLSTLGQELAELELRRIELSGEQSLTIVASIAGTVTGLRAAVGSNADPRLALLNILPQGGTLEAQLYVPTRAIGFLGPGLEVRLMYDAFDYRRFGVQTGTVTTVSSVVFATDEISPNVAVTEPSYRVTVRLTSQSILAYGQRIPLQPGMQLTADIVLEHRSLLRWLLDPLFSLRGRT